MEKIYMPKLGAAMMEGTVTKWYKKVGDKVEKGELLIQIEAEKMASDVEAIAGGTLTEINVEVGDVAKVGAELGIIGE
jgi:pyruvate/2-oxoglutarate dehydrogenase complex dihydrolipoamide acyltransferase (E2) component